MNKATANREIRLTQAFDPIAESYDRWYDTPEGQAIFNAELACFRLLCGDRRGRWLEVGVGTGRFASSLNIAEGIDPSPLMLEIAARRGIKTYAGYAEDQPFPDRYFDGVLLALALCFVADSQQALEECRRVLRPEGRLLLGVIPANSPWGRTYKRKGSEGHPVYARARLRTASETIVLVESAGFNFQDAASTLFWEPGGSPETEPRVETGIVPEAGFLGLLFTKTGSRPPRGHDSGDSK